MKDLRKAFEDVEKSCTELGNSIIGIFTGTGGEMIDGVRDSLKEASEYLNRKKEEMESFRKDVFEKNKEDGDE